MFKNLFLIFIALILGIAVSWLVIYKLLSFLPHQTTARSSILPQTPQIIGFLPYWLIAKADKNYNSYLTNLTYFSLTINPDGSIQKRTTPTETEPGYNALVSGKADSLMNNAKSNHEELSLLLFAGNPDDILSLISDPASHAATLTSEIKPILTDHNFTDVNLDIENVQTASPSAQNNFVEFVQQVRNDLPANSVSLTLEVSPDDLIHERTINLTSVAPLVDRIVLMAYDYHYASSQVTGPISPNGGAGIDQEFDTETAIQKALDIVSPDKLILGVPLYGYEWETLSDASHSAVLPGSGEVASNRRVEDLLSNCATCSASFNDTYGEPSLSFLDTDTNTFHQIVYPDQKSMQAKIALAQKYHLAGIALWALGYEGNSILQPLSNYKSSF